MASQVFQQATGKIPHVQHGFERQAVMGAHGVFRGGSRAACHVMEPHGARHVNSTVD